jgi:hypothetical protein
MTTEKANLPKKIPSSPKKWFLFDETFLVHSGSVIALYFAALSRLVGLSVV